MIKRFINRNNETISDILIVFILTLVFLSLLFHHFFSNPFYYFAADISELYFPWWVFINNAVHSFQFPVLNRFWFSGSLPFAALETSVLYIPYILIQIFFKAQKNLNIAYFFHFGIEMLHYILASISFYLLARKALKLERLAAIFGAIVFACSGVFIGRFLHTLVIISLAWLPLLYYMYIQFINTKKPIFALLTSLILTLIVNSGHPQINLYIYALFAIAIIYFSLIQPKEGKKILLGYSIGIIFLSVFLTMSKIIMTYELSGQIIRTTTETTIRNLYNSIHPLYYLTLIVPYLFGKHFIGYWGSDYPWGNWENFIYIGLLPLFFIPFSFKWKEKGVLWFIYLNFVFVIFMLLGKYNSLSAFVNVNTPLSDSLTMISKMTIFSHFFLSIVVTIGIHVIINSKKQFRLIILLFPYLIILGIILFSLKSADATLLQFTNRPPPTVAAFDFISSNILQAKFLFLLSGISIVMFLFIGKNKLFYLLIAVYALDIFLTAGDFNPIEASPGSPAKYFGGNEITELVKNDKNIFRVDNLWPRNLNMVEGIETTYGYHTVETRSYRNAMSLFNWQNRSVIDLMNIKYFISNDNLGRYPEVEKVLPNLWKNNSALSRVQFVPSCRIVSNEQEMINLITDSKFNPKNEVILYSGEFLAKGKENYECIQNNGKSNQNSVIISKYQTDLISADVSIPENGYLAFSEFQYPGWYAKVDGVEKRLISANLSFYALPISKGNHKVEFIFRSKPLEYGSLVSFSVLLVIIISFIYPESRKYYFRALHLKK
jgi:hypothetical protein